MLLVDLEETMKQFQGGNNVCSVSSSNAATLGDGCKTTFSGVVSAITTTFDFVVAPCETGTSNGGFLSLSNNYAKPTTRLVSGDLKYPLPHSQILHSYSDFYVQGFL